MFGITPYPLVVLESAQTLLIEDGDLLYLEWIFIVSQMTNKARARRLIESPSRARCRAYMNRNLRTSIPNFDEKARQKIALFITQRSSQ